MSKLELQIGYIADSIIETKQKRFNENFTTEQEIAVIRQLIERRVQQKKLKVKFVDTYFEKYFNIINGVITKADQKTKSLKMYISDGKIREAIYDEQFIYYCLCEILICKTNNSIEHTCANCATKTTSECEKFLLGKKLPNKINDCNRWTYHIVESCVNNLLMEERQIIEENQSQQVDARRFVKRYN